MDCTFEFVDEDSILFHKAYIMLCEIFPKMMTYDFFRNFDVTVAIKNDECVGFMLLDIQQDDITDVLTHLNKIEHAKEDILIIASLGVDKKYRKHGIANAYIEWIKKEFPDHNISLHVSIKNTNAINLYKKNGFIVGRTKLEYYSPPTFEPYVGEGVNAYEMFYIC